MKTFSRFALCLLLCSSIARAAPDATERAFKAGNALMEKQDYAGALAQFQIVLKAEPDEPSSLWNGGSAAYFVRDYKTAATFWARLQKQEPQNGHLLAKRMQTSQALGDSTSRNALRTRLFALRKSGKDSTGYTGKPSYCRDQFFVGKDHVLAFEFFELKPRSKSANALMFGRRFEFFVVAPDQKQTLRVECGWSSLEKTASGTFVPSSELNGFYYDAYYPTGPWARRTFGLEPTEPTYEAAKKQVIAIIEGRANPVSGQRRD